MTNENVLIQVPLRPQSEATQMLYTEKSDELFRNASKMDGIGPEYAVPPAENCATKSALAASLRPELPPPPPPHSQVITTTLWLHLSI